jgi:extracellular elastinolytic metalloproteinase
VNGVDVSFTPGADQGDDQKVLNTFFFCNYMHDFFYMLGFDENAGNFQSVNFTGLGAGGDAVLARVHPGRVFGTANMRTPPDGLPPLMNMGAVEFPDGTARHTGLDSDVVFHEYLHGVTNRLVGGRLNSDALREPQSRGMGEGWGDYFALTIQNYNKPQEKVVTGDWVTKRARGIRLHPYDQNYPGTFGDIGTGDYDEEHNIGEIWCAALMQMNRNLNQALNSTTKGHELAWQIVVDGLKLTAANPSFLDARDAILQALSDLNTAGTVNDADFRKARRACWEAFVRYGMGENATSNGASLEGVVGDNTIPAGV